MPDVFYKHFNVKKPQAASVQEIFSGYNPPPYQSLNKNGKVEIREPAPGGVREIQDFLQLPVDVKLLKEDTEELVDYPPPQLTNQTSSCKPEGSAPDSETPPKEDTKTDTPHELDRDCQGLSDAFPYIVSGLPYHQSK